MSKPKVAKPQPVQQDLEKQVTQVMDEGGRTGRTIIGGRKKKDTATLKKSILGG